MIKIFQLRPLLTFMDVGHDVFFLLVSGKSFDDFVAGSHAHVGALPGGGLAEKGLFGHGAVLFVKGGFVEFEFGEYGVEVDGQAGEVFALVGHAVDFADVAAVVFEFGFVGEPGFSLGVGETPGVEGLDGGQEVLGVG